MSGGQLVQSQVQFQDIDAGVPEHMEIGRVGVLGDERFDLFQVQATHLGHARGALVASPF